MKVAIVGGGAAGMFCANILSESSINVTLFEKNNDTLKKFLVTGNGRCNVTNLCDIDEFIDNVSHNSKFLFATLNNFDSFDLVEYLRKNGVTTKIEKGNRVFPSTNKAMTVKQFLDSNLGDNITLKTGCEVKKILRSNGKYKVMFGATSQIFDAVVIATGGLSYPTTGSTGDGYKFAKSLGLEVTDTRPSLCAIRLINVPKNFEGTPFKARITFENNNKEITVKGEGLFTGFGISGPAVHKITSLIKEHEIGLSTISLDFLYKKTYEQCVESFKEYIRENPKKFVVHLVNKFVNIKFAKDILFNLDINEKLQCANVSNNQIQQIINKLKDYKFEVLGFEDINKATITRGGVDCKQINPSTMEAKKSKGLYFIGEVLDVDAQSGGFNLQIAFSTAYSCARDIIHSSFR